ncbi:hypothetical protein GIW81_01055 [Hyphomicrobium sp. xq]|uniref:Uncharacterized protein n=1 Tax=Hyphomicrobium album TaxID=2665159 RepID=A0A6I3KGP3_9HYPH|nr:hypothetical protein [Hyphomicrobium album]MTD92917.1 hypothetical protein [Hyphomicrobium album]
MTRPSCPALLRTVKTIVKHIMIAALFAVAMLGGAELPILHAPQFAEAHAFVHAHMHDADALTEQADAHDHGDTQQPSSDQGCTHVHAHCCAATAILATAAVAPAASVPGQLRLERNGALRYGQLSHPPLRPPRMTA